MDVKCGRGAFMKTRADARQLAELIAANGTANGVRTEAMITAMDAPLGHAVGNALEVQECIDILKGRGPADVKDLSVELAARMIRLAGLAATLEEGRSKVVAALTSGRGLEIFRKMIEQQGGDPRVLDDPSRLPAAPERMTITAERRGIGHAARCGDDRPCGVRLGRGREHAADVVDPGVGAIVRVRVGDAVRAGDPLVELLYRDEWKCAKAGEMIRSACRIGDSPPSQSSLIYEVIE